MQPITHATTVVRADSLAVTELDGETVILNIENGQYFGLNAVGTHVFTMAEAPVQVSDVVEQLAARYDEVPRSQVADDVLAFLAQMREHGLILVADEQMA